MSAPATITRGLTAVLAATFMASACAQGYRASSRDHGAPSYSIQALSTKAARLQLVQAQGDLPTGRDRVSFGLLTPQGGWLTGGSPKVWVARSKTAKPLGPFVATWRRFTGYRRTHDRSPHTMLPGFYAAHVRLPVTGVWWVAGAVDTTSGVAMGVGRVGVASHVVAEPGTKALPVKTSVATTRAKLRKVCSRRPPDPMHYISLSAALRNGKPTVVVFSAPRVCSSRMCGPVTDEVLLVYRPIGRQRANFIHVDIYPPPRHKEVNPAPAYAAWGFRTEPAVLVIDRRGVIRARFEGPVVAAEIKKALRPLL
jgi:hypothetical protein